MDILYNYYVLLALRIAHIGGGVIWVGSAILVLFILVPTVQATHAAGKEFMKNFGPRFSKLMGIATTITVVAGALLYARFFANGFTWIWTTGAGVAFTIGAIAGLISFVLGSTYFGRMQSKIRVLDAQMAAGGPPKPEYVTEMNHLQSSLTRAYWFDFALLVIAMAAMAAARYV